MTNSTSRFLLVRRPPRAPFFGVRELARSVPRGPVTLVGGVRMQLLSRSSRATAALVVLTVAACSDRNAGVTAPAGPQLSAAAALVPGILIGADSNPVTVARGTSATVNVRVT